MRFTLDPLLSPEQVSSLRTELLADDAPWRPGAETAG